MIVHKPTQSLILRLRPDKVATLQQIFPKHVRTGEMEGYAVTIVKHTIPMVKVLRNMGIKAPSPIRYQYDWPRPARFPFVFDHQYTTSEFLTLHNRCFVLNDMGTSKTASTLWAIDYLMSIGYVKKVIIAATLSTLESVWLNECFDVCMHRQAVICHGDKKRDRLAADVDIYIINHAGLKVLENDIRARKDIDLIVVDEASVYRNAQTDQYEVLERIARERKLWLLTGAPCPNAPTDAWALARLVNKQLVPPYFTQFKRKVMNQVTTYKWVPKPGSHEVAYEVLQPGIRFKKSDCITLPPLTISNRKTEITKEQQDAYQTMKNQLVLSLGGATLTAANAADGISKLRQILCGAIKTGDKQYEAIPHGPRLKVLTEIIEQASAKVIVVVPFKGIAQVLREEVNEWHGKRGDSRRCEVVNGDVSLTERNRIFQSFRDDDDLTELICHPKVMAHGLNLTQANVLVFYAPIYSNDEYGQVKDRINRPGQKNHMTIIRMYANALEMAIYGTLDDRTRTQDNMLELYRKEVIGA